MIINVSSLLKNEINETIDIFLENIINLPNNYNLFDNKAKFIIKGRFNKIGKIIFFNGKIKSNLIFKCDKCLDKVNYKLNSNISEKFFKDKNLLNSDEDIWIFEGNVIDIKPCIYSNIFENIPMSITCKKDCKGLCSVCGTNLNLNSCNCNNKTIDSPFKRLKYIFNNNKEV